MAVLNLLEPNSRSINVYGISFIFTLCVFTNISTRSLAPIASNFLFSIRFFLIKKKLDDESLTFKPSTCLEIFPASTLINFLLNGNPMVLLPFTNLDPTTMSQ